MIQAVIVRQLGHPHLTPFLAGRMRADNNRRDVCSPRRAMGTNYHPPRPLASGGGAGSPRTIFSASLLGVWPDLLASRSILVLLLNPRLNSHGNTSPRQ
jgi:hypothetical protein